MQRFSFVYTTSRGIRLRRSFGFPPRVRFSLRCLDASLFDTFIYVIDLRPQVPCRTPNWAPWSTSRAASLVSISARSPTCTNSGDPCPVLSTLGWASCTSVRPRWPSSYWRSPSTPSGRSARGCPWRTKTNTC